MSEATIMKDFHHQNVLELIGVTVRYDVPFVILPFMEYGDLRTYISNQNLVRTQSQYTFIYCVTNPPLPRRRFLMDWVEIFWVGTDRAGEHLPNVTFKTKRVAMVMQKPFQPMTIYLIVMILATCGPCTCMQKIKEIHQIQIEALQLC